MATTKKERGQKKEWARLLYTRENLTQKEIAEKTGVSAVTVNKWVKEGSWDRLKQSMLVTREVQLNRMYMQLDEMTSVIMAREEGSRFADSREAAAIRDLTAAIKKLETEASVGDIYEVARRLLDWLRPVNADRALLVANVIDEFIKHVMKQ
ncbi:MAG: putative DNA-binding transcriptional regulator [Tannerella sp.]|jgi:transcriptional regulator with XRE-family HTH domain|nr:putative DNA-binding transcriptional regulator [Tannerella sp.]